MVSYPPSFKTLRVRPNTRGWLEAVNPIEENTHVFIVRIWCERREIEGRMPTWRGMIEHVPSGERRYFKDLDEIHGFIAPICNGWA